MMEKRLPWMDRADLAWTEAAHPRDANGKFRRKQINTLKVEIDALQREAGAGSVPSSRRSNIESMVEADRAVRNRLLADEGLPEDYPEMLPSTAVTEAENRRRIRAEAKARKRRQKAIKKGGRLTT